MQLVHITLSALLLQAQSSYGKAAAVPRQSARPEHQNPNSLVVRKPQGAAAPSVSGPSTFNTSPTPAAVTTASLSTSTPPPAAEAPATTPTTTTALPATSTTTSSTSATPTGPRNHNIAVAQNGTQFTPSTLKNIPPGDSLTFYFYPSNYSIVQSSFGNPCEPLSGTSVYSGFNPAEGHGIARSKFVMNISNTDTMWIYAVDGRLLEEGKSSAARCAKDGMVMVVNPKAKVDGQTLNRYRENAGAIKDVSTNVNTVPLPGAVSGGEVRSVSDREKARWEGKHPLGGNARNGTFEDGTGVDDGTSENGTYVGKYENKAAGRGNSLMGFVVLVGACVFGLGF